MSAKSDYLIARIKELQTFQAALADKSPITVSILGVNMTVDNSTSPDEYARGVEVLGGHSRAIHSGLSVEAGRRNRCDYSVITMNMRDLISICESDLSQAFLDVPRETLVLPAGTMVFHGTDRPLDEWDPRTELIYDMAWFGATFQVANDYAKFKRSGSLGKPYVIQYRTNRNLNLLEASSPEWAAKLDALYGDYTTDEIAEAVCQLGFEGWHIKDQEIMIADGDAVDFVKVLKAR